MRNFFPAIISAALLVSCGTETKPPAGDTSARAPVSPDGAALFESKCVLCHGGDGKRGVGGATDLTISTLSHDSAVKVVSNGRLAMRPFKEEMSAEEIEAVVRYAESLRGK